MGTRGLGAERGRMLVGGLAAGIGTLGLWTLMVGAVAAPTASGVASIAVHPKESARPGDGSTSAIGWASSNWSGYAATRSTYTAITGNWKVPAVQPSGNATYSAAWAGIDGFNNNSLIQTGTEQDYYNGAAHYTAWWTTSAQGFVEQAIPHPVFAGDAITATITKTNPSTSSWTLTLADTTQNWTFAKTLTYTGPGASAEWIMEAPTVGGRIAPLANYASPTTFDPGTVNGGANPGLVASDGGELVTGNKHRLQIESIPSGPDRDTDGFNISYGSTAPPPPGS